MSSEAEGIIDLYQRKALDWVRRREHGGGLMEQSWLDRFRALMPPNGSILDIGCGSAVPIARYLIETGHSVTGVDTSATFIDLAGIAIRRRSGSWRTCARWRSRARSTASWPGTASST